MDIEFSQDQQIALDGILDWYNTQQSDKPAYIMGGAAGTGKSTLVSHLSNYISNKSIRYCAYTGKAATVLRRKMSSLGIGAESISTIHSLMYDAIIDKSTGDVVGWKLKPTIDADLIVVDESSMVPLEIYNHLLAYKIPLLFVGDHYQLPPVSQDDFNLMDNADIKLDEPHRFAKDSPIIKLATKIRRSEKVKYGSYGKLVSKRRKRDITPTEIEMFFRSDDLKNGDSIILCGFNKTRVKINGNVRTKFGYEGLLNVGERVVCLRNSKKSNIPLFNGNIGTVRNISARGEISNQHTFQADIEMDGISEGNFKGRVYTDIFGDEKPNVFTNRSMTTQCFDYGYALSVHKSQGSSWPRVCVLEEQCDLWDHNRWLYTAVTRSEKELLIVKN